MRRNPQKPTTQRPRFGTGFLNDRLRAALARGPASGRGDSRGEPGAADASDPGEASASAGVPAAALPGGLRLTQLSHGSGCGCKLSPTELSAVLREAFPEGTGDAEPGSPPGGSPGLLIGNETRDDAAVLDLGVAAGGQGAASEGPLLVATADFFTPIVDDPYQYGRVAAANALSDVWAMGGRPVLALAILGWPAEELDPALAAPIVRGGRDVCREAGVPLAGGHSIDAREPFFGLAVNGVVEPARLRTNAGARPGDLLYLTKPLGTGLLTTAEKYGSLRPQDEGLAAEIMGRLNDVGYALGGLPGVHAMTDVTGFGLLGHLLELAQAAELGAELDWAALVLPTDLRRYVAAGALAKGLKNNWHSYGAHVTPLQEPVRSVLCDPQTGGGLLVAVAPEAAAAVEDTLRAAGLSEHVRPVGRLVARDGAPDAPAVRVLNHEAEPALPTFFGLDAAEKNRQAAQASGRAAEEVSDGAQAASESAVGGASAAGSGAAAGDAAVPAFNASCAPPNPSEASPRELWKMMRAFFGDLVRYRKDVKRHARWIERFAERKGYSVNPHWMMNANLRLWLVESERAFGQRYCPCFEPSDDDRLNKALVCPCKFIDQDIADKGTCHCTLFGAPDLDEAGWRQAEARLVREYRVDLKTQGDLVDTTGIPTDPYRGLKVPDAYHLAKRALLLRGAPVSLLVERDFEARNIQAWAKYKGIACRVDELDRGERAPGASQGFRVTLGGG